MIQIGTFFNVIDNSGARKVCCIKILKNYKKRYAFLGDVILISIKSIRTKRKITSKVKKGEIYKAIIIRTINGTKKQASGYLTFFENSVILLNKKNKFLGTRIFGSVPSFFRRTKYLRLLSLASGSII
jgi:large subunit ribosomal protein L14